MMAEFLSCTSEDNSNKFMVAFQMTPPSRPAFPIDFCYLHSGEGGTLQILLFFLSLSHTFILNAGVAERSIKPVGVAMDNFTKKVGKRWSRLEDAKISNSDKFVTLSAQSAVLLTWRGCFSQISNFYISGGGFLQKIQ